MDIEQVVIRGRLVLGVLLGCDAPPDLTGIHAGVSALAADLGLEAEITTGSDRPGSSSSSPESARPGRLHVTVLGSPLAPVAITAIAGRIAASGANIDRISRLAQRPVTCIELDVSGGNPAVAPGRPGPRRGRAGGRRGGPARRPAPAGHAADRDGRGLHPDPGRGDRPAGRPGRLRARGGEGDRGRDARRSGLRRVPARAGGAAGRAGGWRARRGPRRAAADPGRAHADRDPGRPRLQVRDRQRRLRPGDRAAGRRARHRLRGGQRARDRRRKADRAAAAVRSSTGPARRTRCAGSPRTPVSRCPRRWRSATAPTTWT